MSPFSFSQRMPDNASFNENERNSNVMSEPSTDSVELRSDYWT